MTSKSGRYPYRRCQILTFDCGLAAPTRLLTFLDLITELKIPTTKFGSNIVDQSALDNLACALEPPSTGEIRNVVFLCDGQLEEQISFSARFLLEAGFEIRLIRDLIVARDLWHMQFQGQRLVHSGALPITWKQLIYE
jgi:hypothetical protein